MTVKSIAKLPAAACVMLAASIVFPGCARKEKLLDIETPAGEVEVERDLDTGEVGVDVDISRDDNGDRP